MRHQHHEGRGCSGDAGRPLRQISRVKIRVAAREAYRNIVSGTSHTFAITIALAVCIAMLFGMDLMQINRLIVDSRQYAQSGAATYTISLQDGINGVACEGLSGIDGVQAVGAIRQSDRKITFATLPSTGIPTYEVTPGAVRVFLPTSPDDGTDADGMGIILSSTVADTLGVQVGQTIAMNHSGDARVRGIYQYPDDGRDSQYSYAVLEPVNSDQPFDACLVRAWPVPNDIEMLMYLAASITSKDQHPQISQLNSRFGSTPPSQTLFDERLTVFAPWVMLTVAFILGLVMIRMRRLEFASALHAGIPKEILVLQVLIELSASTVCAILLCMPLIVWVALAVDTSNMAAAYDSLLRVPVAGYAGLLVGGLVAIFLTHERQLFSYFKNR